MISLDKALADLVRHGLISTEEAIAKANRPETIRGGPQASAAA
jgi:Tfp pilus assembly ATPase PilU